LRNRVSKNVTLEKGESIQKEFLNMPMKGRNGSILVTNKRLVIYTSGMTRVRGRMVRRMMMNEIDLASIHRFEYFYDVRHLHWLFRLIGFLFLLGGAGLAGAVYTGYLTITIPGIVMQWYYPYAAGAFLAFLGLVLLTATLRALSMVIKSGTTEETKLEFFPRESNEKALRYLAGRVHAR